MTWSVPTGVDDKLGRLDAIACGPDATPGVHADWLPCPPGTKWPLPEAALLAAPPTDESGWPLSLRDHVRLDGWRLAWWSETPRHFRFNRLREVALCANARLAAVTDGDAVVVWDVPRARECLEVRLPFDDERYHSAAHIALTPCGTKLIMACPLEGVRVSVFDLLTRRRMIVSVPSWCDLACERVSLHVAHHGRLAVVGSPQGTFAFDATTGEVRGQWRDVVWPLGISTDDRWVLAGHRGELVRVSLGRDAPPQSCVLDGPGTAYWESARVSPEGDELWVIAGRARVERYDLRTLRLIEAHEVPTHDNLMHEGICISPVAPQFVVRDNDGIWMRDQPAPCVLVDLRLGPEPVALRDEHGEPLAAHCGQFSADGRWLVLGSWDSLYIVDARTARTAMRLRLGQMSDFEFPSFDSTGERLACVVDRPLRKREVCVWNLPRECANAAQVATPEPPLRLVVPRGEAVEAVAFSPDGSLIVAHLLHQTDDSLLARIWDATSGHVVREVHAQTSEMPVYGVHALALSRDSRLLSLHDRAGYLYDVGSGRLVAQLAKGKEPVVCACFTSCGTALLTGDADSRATLWDVATGKPRWSFRRRAPVIFDVSFAENDTVACIHTDFGLRTLRADTGKRLANELDRTHRAPWRRRERPDTSLTEGRVVDRSGTRLASVGPGNCVLVYTKDKEPRTS